MPATVIQPTECSLAIPSSLAISRLRRWFMMVIAVFLLGLTGGLGSGQAAEPSLRERFLREAPKAWEEYLAFARTLQGRWTSRMTFSNHNSVTHHQIKQNRRCRLAGYEVESRKSKSDEYLRARGRTPLMGEMWVVHREYAFMLARRSMQSPWVVTGIARSDDDKKYISDKIEQQFNIMTGCLISLVQTRLQKLLDQPTFRLLDVRQTMYENKECVEIVFDNKHEIIIGEDFIPEQRGKVILDPQRYWTVYSAELVSKYMHDNGPEDYKESIRITTRDGKSGYPIIVNHKYYRTDKPDEGITKEFELDEVERLPQDEEFTLTAFGLPEPVGLERPVRWWLWTGVAGVLLIIVGAVFFRLAQRRRRTG